MIILQTLKEGLTLLLPDMEIKVIVVLKFLVNKHAV